LPAGNYSNANVANFIPTYSGNIGSLTAIGNIKTISFFVGDGSQLTNLPVVNTDWANIGNIINVNGPTNIAIGQYAGNTQGNFSIAIGQNAGNNIQGGAAVAVGYESGSINQGIAAVAIGSHAGNSIQGNNAVSIGQYSGAENQGSQAVAIGTNAGQLYQGANSIAIGTNAGQGFINAQANNTIILNATGLELDGGNAQTDSFYVAPIRNDTIDTSTPLYYNASTKEITYNSISAEVPTSSTSTGSVGQIASDATYLYVCVAQNNWVRSAIVGGW
jgi:hypothetical protein